MFIIVAYFKVTRGLYRLFIIQATRRRQCVARDYVDRDHGPFFLCFRGQVSFGLTCQCVIFNGRVVLDLVFSVFGRKLVLGQEYYRVFAFCCMVLIDRTGMVVIFQDARGKKLGGVGEGELLPKRSYRRRVC